MILGIFGDGTASEKLVTAALNDLLEAHVADTPDESFWLCIGVRKNSPVIYHDIAQWAMRNTIDVAYYTPMTSKELQMQLDVDNGVHHKHDKYMIELVDRLISEGGGKIYALLGDKEPSVDVRRALARALDNGLEVRDLAEAGLTYVGLSDNPLTVRSIIMANDLTLVEAGDAADNDDQESMEALTELAGQFGLDPDDYPTWADLAEAIEPFMAETPNDEPVDDEEEAPKPRRSGKLEQLSREELEGSTVPQLRALAKQLGIEGWEKNRSAKLIDGILEAQSGGATPEPDEDETESPAPRRKAPAASSNGDWQAALAAGLRAFADALEG